MNNKKDESYNDYLRLLKISDINIIQLKEKINKITNAPMFMGGYTQTWVGNDVKNDGLKLLSRVQDANSWIDKSNYLSDGIKTSLDLAFGLLEKNNNGEINFTPWKISKKDKMIYYCIENSIYRIFSMWEVVAHLYNHFFDLKIPINEVEYFRVFNISNKKKLDKKLQEVVGQQSCAIIKNEFSSICRYIRNKYQYNDGNVEGNHKYLKNIRNRFTHRDNPHNFRITNSSNSFLGLPDAPLYEIKCIVDEFYQLFLYLCTMQKLFCIDFSRYGIDHSIEIKSYNPLLKYIKEIKNQKE